ncbi:MAG TPA: AraC family transcriptional regulator [Clostridiales bacterium]|nr:AraC family transcriptional regulator [Clostridiales bacterium]
MVLDKYFYKDCNRIIDLAASSADGEVKLAFYDKNHAYALPPDYFILWNSLLIPKGSLAILAHPVSGWMDFHSHDFFEFIYVYKGSCTIKVDSRELTLEAGSLCLLNLQAKHSIELGSIKEDMVFNILVQPDYFNSTYFRLTYLPNNEYIFDFFLESMVNHSMEDNYILFRPGLENTYDDLIRHLIREYYIGKSHKEEMMNFLFSSLLIELSRSYGSHIDQSSQEELKKYKITEITGYIYEHYKDITLKELAEHFNYNNAYLSTIIKKYTGTSFSEILHTFRFLKSCQLLTETRLTVADIADEVGYSNQTWFVNNFKKRYGIAPSEYRKKYKNM